MKLSDLQAKLTAAARRDVPSDDVPYAFEKRIMARLPQCAPANAWAYWSASLWRAAACCMAVTILCGIWSYSASRAQAPPQDLSQDLAAAVFAPINQSSDQPADTAW